MPNPNLLKVATRITDIGFKIQSKLLVPYKTIKGDSRLFILKNKPKDGKPFTILAIINPYGISEQVDFRNRRQFEVARSEAIYGVASNQTVGDLLGTASHIYLDPQGEMYSIFDGDEPMVSALQFTFKISGWLVSDKFNPVDYE